MNLKILTGRANPPLAEAVASLLGVPLGRCSIEDFPDGQCQVEIREDVQERDVYLIQPTAPPAAGRLLELLLMATHGLFVDGAAERLASFPIQRLIVTDSVRRPHGTRVPVQTVSVQGELAGAITRLHAGHP